MPMMKKKPTPTAPDPYSPNAKVIQPFMPGQQGLLAEQLNAGFGGGVDAQMGLLDQWTSPMKLPGKFNYGNPMKDMGGGMKNGIPDLTRQEMKIAQPWVPSNGAFRNPQQEIDFRALDPKIQEWLRAQWGGGQ